MNAARLMLGLGLLLAAAPGAAQGAQLCAWMIEVNQPDEVHDFQLWLEADEDMDLLYKMAGFGVRTDCCLSHSPGSGSYSLKAGAASKPWSYGVTLNPPGAVEIIAELHEAPVSIFDESPAMAAFTFVRHLREAETAAPPVLAKRQCATVTPPRRRP